MTHLDLSQPDVAIHLDADGIIRQATIATAVFDGAADELLGRRWEETVDAPDAEKVRMMLERARNAGVTAFEQFTQRFPGGVEQPIEFAAVRVDHAGSMLAIGKSVEMVTELQTRLVAAQQAMEQDYWKLREIETRYRLLFDASNEAVLLVNAKDNRIVEANPSAIRALGLAPVGREFVGELSLADRDGFRSMLERVREQGKAPATLVHIGSDRTRWMVRASLMTSDDGQMFLLQLTPIQAEILDQAGVQAPTVDALIDRMPEGFVVVDVEGIIQRSNRAFLDLLQVAAEPAVVGEPIGRWLGRPGADIQVLLSNLRRNGFVRAFSTTIQGEFSAEADVEVSAVADNEQRQRFVGLLVRDVSNKLDAMPVAGESNDEFVRLKKERIGRTTLRELTRDTVTKVERRYIEVALEATGGNRTAASELLGLSRQSLHVKLNRYGLE